MANTFEFKDVSIKNLALSEKRISYRDKNSKLYIRVGSRTKKWFIRFQFNGKRYGHALGSYPEMTLREARAASKSAFEDIDLGINPAQRKQDYKTAPTMNDLWLMYQLEPRYLQKSESGQKEECRKWDREFAPYIGHIKVADIKRSTIKGVLMRKASRHRVMANRLFTLLSGVFVTALDTDLLKVHPMYQMARPGGRETPRTRKLEDDEIRIAWKHFDTMPDNQRDILKLILLTCQRPGEIMGMRWSDINFEENLWTQETTKTRNSFLVPLSTQVQDILSARQKDSEYVFPGRYKHKGDRPVINPIQLKPIDGIEKHFTPHDLRRTGRTLMGRLKIKHQIRERCLNHSIGGVAGVYDLHDYKDEKKSALQKLADEIISIISDRN